MEDEAIRVMHDAEQRWSHLTITDDFVFGKVMLDEDICREVLEAILRVPIERIEYVGRQETIELTSSDKGIRLDVYVRDGAGTIYNVEMQAVDTHELPQRARYYQALMALDQIEKGNSYRTLKNAYVIFVCSFDMFKRGRRVYSFQNRCDEDGSLVLGDGAHVVFLAASSPEDPQAGTGVNELLDYVATGKVGGGLSSRLDTAVSHVIDNGKWRLEYMMLAVRDQLNVDKGIQLGLEKGKREGLEQGKQEGLAKGIEQGKQEGLAQGLEQGKQEGLAKGIERGKAEGLAKGEARFAKLVLALTSQDRSSEIGQAAADPSVRKKLYDEMDIK